MSDELDEMMGRVHDGVSVFDFEGRSVPCIIVGDPKYAEMVSKTAGKSLGINTDLNIFHDGLGHAFVDVTLAFSRGGMVEKFLIDAQKNIKFFEMLAETAMLALSSRSGGESVFMIQLPRPEKAYEALTLIRDALAGNNGAVTGI
ncbi:MAG: hypothetical protein D9C04_02345 [Nitrosopumilus sp. B06]|nr:MAG: hypothetical protein D9C04_02345 [Nitrosopumilus sp. B06]